MAEGAGRSWVRRYARQRACAAAVGVLAVAALAFAPAVALGDVGLEPPVSYPAAAGAHDVAVGDFNGDGRLDLATANATDGSFSILLGRAGGTFEPAVTTALGAVPSTVSAADFDGDGNLDLAFAIQTGNQVIVHWGTGTGSGFDTTKTTVTTPSRPWDAIGTDLDGNDRADLVTANRNESTISVFLADSGSRGFGPASDTRTDIFGGPVALAAGAVFGPKPQDIAVANQSNGSVTSFRGNGAAGWSAIGTYGVGGLDSQPNGVAIANIAGDGHGDIVTSNAGTNTATILPATDGGGPSGQQNTTLPAGSNPTGIVTGDFTGDGRADAAVVAHDSGKVLVLTSGGDLVPMIVVASYDAGTSPVRAGAGDFNDDGAADVAVASDSGSGAVRILLSHGAPTLAGQASASVAVGGALTSTVTLAGATPAASGTIAFDLYGPDDATCSGTPVTDTRTVAGNGAYTASPVTAPHVGTYRWVVSYSGDANNDAVTGSCTDANQSTVVTKAVTTVPVAATSPITVGQTAPASTTLSGGHSPTGSIVLKAYPTTDCSGPAAYSSDALTVSGNGTHTAAPVFTPATAGTYRWIASYDGDADNAAAASACGAAGAATVVGTFAPTLSPSVTSPVVVGGAVTMTATLAGGHSPTGSVTFAAYANATCTGAPAYSSGAVTVSGNGTYEPATAFTPTEAGTYRVLASYSGDANNEPVAGACGEAGASVDVSKATQTIAFPPPPDQLAGGAEVALTATASSGLAVTYTSTTTDVCTIIGITVRSVSVGTCSITASQPGDATFSAAPEVVRSFAVTDGTAPAPAPTPPTPPTPTPTPKPDKPKLTFDVPARVLLTNDTLTASCRLAGARLRRCTITVRTRSGQTLGSSTGTKTVRVRLTSKALALLARTPAGLTVRISAIATPAKANPVSTTRTTLLLRQNNPIPAAATFSGNGDRLTASEKRALTRLARQLRTGGATTVTCIGHTSRLLGPGDTHYTRTLSKRRAATVCDTLADAGLRVRYIVRGAGKSDPLAPNDTPAGRARNRRVEIIVTYRH